MAGRCRCRHSDRVSDVLTFSTEAASDQALTQIRLLLADAFAGRFSEHDWEHTLGGWHGLHGSWANDLHATVKDLQRWQRWGASVGMQGRKLPGLDIDVDDVALPWIAGTKLK